MEALTHQARALAQKLLAEDKVDLVIGPGRGTLPWMAQAVFARTPEETEKLDITPLPCENLAGYVHYIKPDTRVAFIVKGCEGRALLQLINERQLPREQAVIIAYPCPGIVDVKALLSQVDATEETLESLEWPGGAELEGTAAGKSFSVGLSEIWTPNCRECAFRKAPEADFELEGQDFEPVEKEFATVEALAALSPEERWQRFQAFADRCVRCYACRNACPMCYCDECFVTCKSPVYVRNATDPSDNLVYHIIRALHLGGRCVDCGACTRACPVGLDLRMFNKVLDKVSLEAFNYRPGSFSGQKPVLAEHSLDDPEDFMLT